MILFRILFWLLLLPLRIALALALLLFRILGGIGRLGGVGVTRGPLNRPPVAPAWPGPWGGNPWLH